MNLFEYVRPTSLAEAIAAGSRAGAAYLAGGTNLLDLMKSGVTRPSCLVDISRLPGLDRIEPLADGGYRVGALVRNSDLAHDARFARTYPAVAEALLSSASAQLRNAATVGGNLLQRTRCPYFYDTSSACNRRNPSSGCDARDGESHLHAILGWSAACIAVHPSDLCVPLSALGALVEIEGASGRRSVPLMELHRVPQDGMGTETVLQPGDLITAVCLPAEASAVSRYSRYLKVGGRTSFAFAVVSAAAGLEMAGDRIRQGRLALGGVAAKPWRATPAEQVLVGARPDAGVFREAAEAALADARPSGANGYKIELAKRLTVRVLALAAAGTPERLPALPASPFAPLPGDSSRA